MALPIPVAPGAIALADEDLVGLSLEAVYHHCVGTKVEAAALERELAARFYRALYGRQGGNGEAIVGQTRAAALSPAPQGRAVILGQTTVHQ